MTEVINCEHRYTPQQMKELFECARSNDVDHGGRYDCRSAAINIWSHPWTTEALKSESTIIGSLYFDWTDNTLRRIEYDMDEEAIRDELGQLEIKAFGQVLHGSDKARVCKVCSEGPESMLKWQEQMMKKHGWFIHFVYSKESLNAHTHGLIETFKHPDLQIVLPLGERTCHSVFHTVVDRIKKGDKFEHNQVAQEIIQNNLSVQFVEAQEGGRNVLRIIFPDKNGALDEDKMYQDMFRQQWIGLHEA